MMAEAEISSSSGLWLFFSYFITESAFIDPILAGTPTVLVSHHGKKVVVVKAEIEVVMVNNS